MSQPVFDHAAPADRASPPAEPPRPVALWGLRASKATRAKLLAFDRDQLPFARFEDCNVGGKRQREAAFASNKERKNLILPYIGAWALRGAAMGAALVTSGNAQALGMDTSALQAVFGVCFVGCLTVCVVLSAAWMGLTCMHD